MNLQAVKSWLAGRRDYAIGVKLYGLYGKKLEVKEALKSPKNPFRQKLLENAMQELLEPAPPPPPAATDDLVIRELKAKAIPLLKERDDLHAKLRLFRTVEERGRAAHRILDLDDEVDDIYDAIRYYEQHRKLPEAELPFTPITDPSRWEQRYQTCGRYVSRYQDKLKTDPENSQYKKLLAAAKAEQLWLAKKLNKWH